MEVTMTISRSLRVAVLLGLLLPAGVPAQQGRMPSSTVGARYVALAWNDLGMHCLNPTYDTAVILPPYNTVWTQVVKRGNPPQVVTTGLTASYRIVNNTKSASKRSFGQFWDNCLKLFGITLARDTGLNLEDASIHNGLAGTMIAKSTHFQANGIPVVPVDDAGTWDPYQVIEVTVKDQTGATLAVTKTTIPTSDEINCAKCHGTDAFKDMLAKHDRDRGTSLTTSTPVLCAKCHGSPALGATGPGPVGVYLSKAIHGFHADQGAACYDCHPGAKTTCSRSVAHTAADGNCVSCHGNVARVAGSIVSGRVPWVSEPKCADCHAGVSGVDTGAVLYRNASGHGGVSCAACHGSPHAMAPSQKTTDNLQFVAYQGKAMSIGDCRVCHRNSQGEGAGEFAQEHGTGKIANACFTCHTGFSNAGATRGWPHSFQWKRR
jgi:hypothetical protein